MKRGLLLSLLLVTACATVAKQDIPLTGEWGGTHVGLSLTPAGGLLHYDCATGTIPGPLLTQRDGSFFSEGTHTPGWGGPEIEGQAMPTYRVRYIGRVRGNTMNLQGQVENGVLLGPFTLRRGAEPIIFRCL